MSIKNTSINSLSKIVKASEMSRIEKMAFTKGCSESDFMETAGIGIANSVMRFYLDLQLQNTPILLLCGKGNNAGDAYVAGYYLLKQGFKVISLQVFPFQECSPLCKRQANRFSIHGGEVQMIDTMENLSLPRKALVLDGLVGTGFQGKLDGLMNEIVDTINNRGLPVVAIDIPSGLNGNDGSVGSNAIHAWKTIYLGLPKTGFFLNEGWNHVGELHRVDFGLPEEDIQIAEADFHLISTEFASKCLPPIVRNRHKYQAGYVVGLTGSPSMPGAAILSGLSTLRAGAGITRLWFPASMQTETSQVPADIIRSFYQPSQSKEIIDSFNQAAAVYIGPGIGRSQETLQLLQEILTHLNRPFVLDADGLTLVAENNLSYPPNIGIITPHKGEMDRLLQIEEKNSQVNLEYLKLCQQYVNTYSVTLVLKGAPTFILHPGRIPAVNPRGNPGMAKAGTGDVLTGIISALLAQKMPAWEAAILGVTLHGIAGEFAADQLTSYSTTASDLIDYIPEAFEYILALK